MKCQIQKEIKFKKGKIYLSFFKTVKYFNITIYELLEYFPI